MSKIRNEASRRSFSPAVRRLADHLEAQEHAVEFYDVIALGGMDKALDIEEMVEAMTKASWPDGGHDGFPSRKVAEMLAEALRVSVLDVPAEATR